MKNHGESMVPDRYFCEGDDCAEFGRSLRHRPAARAPDRAADGTSLVSFSFVVEPALPPLAWCARHRHGADTVTVVCGRGVLRGNGWFFEGAWTGPLDASGLRESYRFGSGAALDDGGAVYLPPSHTLGRLHVCRVADGIVVSNSLAFALAAAGDAPDPRYPFYARDLYSVRLGFGRCRTSLPLARGTLELAYVRPVAIDPALNLRRREAPEAPPPFTDFAQYRDFLASRLAALVANAADRARPAPLRPLVALSSGYDSTAGAALAAPLGCRDALSFRRARKPASGLDDGGEAVAARLGLVRHVFDWDGYKALPGLPEAEFFAALPTGEDVSFAACAELLAGRLLLVGYHGDSVWTPGKTDSPDFVRGDASGGSLEEFRLRTGFALVPFAFIGAEWQRRINEIVAAPEMDPWRMGGDYDRPIPRRIAEEAGLPRGSFAIEKKAVAVSFALAGADPGRAQEALSPASQADYRAFLARFAPARTATARLLAAERGAALWVRIVNRVNWAAARLRLGLRIKPPLRAYMLRLGRDWPIVHWALSKLAPRYAPALVHLGQAAESLRPAPESETSALGS
jgi:hypothetical protein